MQSAAQDDQSKADLTGHIRSGAKSFNKRDFPPAKVRRFLEAGPVVLVSSDRGERNIVTLGWQRYPTTVHYRGDGVFMISRRNVSY